MPNIKSAIKRVEVIERNNQQNRSVKSEIKAHFSKMLDDMKKSA